jgi:acetoin utilization protein AcuB
MATNVYTVGPDAPLDVVVAEMAEHKYGSAIVTNGPTIEGIFTTVDACRALVDALRETGEQPRPASQPRPT